MRPVSPWGPPITNLPVGLIKNFGTPGGYFTFRDTASEVIAPDRFFWSQFGYTHKIQSFVFKRD
mgnify:CR=1 FL=1